jgi:hypothetical protein
LRAAGTSPLCVALRFLPGAIGVDARDDIAHRHRLAFLLQDREDTGRFRRELDAGLVGFELEQRLVDGDALAVTLDPTNDDALGDRFAEGGDADFNGHGVSQGRC